MKLAYRQIESFVKSPDPVARVILVYGPDYGLVRERSEMIGRSIVEDLHDPFNVAVLNSATLAEDPARLSDEAGAISMMGGDRLIRIEEGGDKLTILIKNYLEAPSQSTLVIIQAGELGPRSSLRKLCESAKNAAAVPCYIEEGQDVARYIRDYVSGGGYSIGSDAVQWLSQNISGDRLRMRSELEKLLIYKGDLSDLISLADVQEACGVSGTQGLDDLVMSVGGRDTQGAMRSFATLSQEGVNFVVILRSLQNHFRRLHMVRCYLNEGVELDAALKKLSPPVFFKQAPAFKSQGNSWSFDLLEHVMTHLRDLEAQCKQTGMPVDALCSQAILAISKSRRG